jgi:YegS/Rv2252/BmrU family lipid kinase
LVNPAAGHGRAGRRLPDIRRALDRAELPHDAVITTGPGNAKERAAEARRDGIECLAVVGGDGTLNEVSQAYIDGDGNALPGPDLALIPAGTGGDFRKSFGLADDIQAAVDRLRVAEPKPLDLGVLELTDDGGQRVVKAFINITSFGIGGLTDRIVNDSPKWMGGRAAFLLGTLRAMLVYRNAPVRVLVDGEPWLERPIFNVAVANGQFFGGGMKIAPNADPGDGSFDVVAMCELGRVSAAALSRKIYRGAHLGSPGVEHTRAARVVAEPLRAEPVLIDMDGETPGRLPLTARVVHGALRIRA